MSGGAPAASVSNNGSLQRDREFKGSMFIADLLTRFEKQLTVPKTLPWVPHVYDSSGLLDFRLRMRMQNAGAVAEEPDMLLLQRYAWRTFENRFGGVSTRRTIELMPTNISWEVLGQPNSTDQLLWCQHLQMQIAGIVFEYGHCTGRICPHTGRTEIIAPEVQMLYAENVPRWNRDIVEHPNLVCVPRRASHRAFQGAPTTTFPTVFSNEVLDELWGEPKGAKLLSASQALFRVQEKHQIERVGLFSHVLTPYFFHGRKLQNYRTHAFLDTLLSALCTTFRRKRFIART